ncbi:hypothetical protein GCM10012285_54950 [Streptomyces kronopolitis]|uniref:Uncharacterized protein n=1 Tax=Streptomyces kronopolitis TaxID=1612435 RepID=A0ABQ2JX80_9ACTN|nr:hypothetical protein GCM10012285_54950 [Streptomyces kronopolitis]
MGSLGTARPFLVPGGGPFRIAVEQPASAAIATAVAMAAVTMDALTLAAAVIGHPIPGACAHLPSD